MGFFRGIYDALSGESLYNLGHFFGSVIIPTIFATLFILFVIFMLIVIINKLNGE